MEIEIYIDGVSASSKGEFFDDSILGLMKKNSRSKLSEEFRLKNAKEMSFIKNICQKNYLPDILNQHITFDDDFFNKLIPNDIILCSCLKPKTAVGQVLKELMVDNFQLILRNRIWMKADHLLIYFEAINISETTVLGRAIQNSNK